VSKNANVGEKILRTQYKTRRKFTNILATRSYLFLFIYLLTYYGARTRSSKTYM